MISYNDSYEEYALNVDFSEENLENELFCKSFEKSESGIFIPLSENWEEEKKKLKKQK